MGKKTDTKPEKPKLDPAIKKKFLKLLDALEHNYYSTDFVDHVDAERKYLNNF